MDEKALKMAEKDIELCKQLALMELDELIPTICVALDLWCKARGEKVSPKQLMAAIISLMELREEKGENKK